VDFNRFRPFLELEVVSQSHLMSDSCVVPQFYFKL
jgi:hypothetical protein